MEQIDRPTTYMRCTVGLLTILAPAVLAMASPAAAGAITVGTGTAESCTEDALSRAIARAGTSGGATIRFNCRSTPVTIFVTSEGFVIPHSTKINSGGTVTITMKR